VSHVIATHKGVRRASTILLNFSLPLEQKGGGTKQRTSTPRRKNCEFVPAQRKWMRDRDFNKSRET